MTPVTFKNHLLQNGYMHSLVPYISKILNKSRFKVRTLVLKFVIVFDLSSLEHALWKSRSFFPAASVKGHNSIKYNATLNLIVAVYSVESGYKCVWHKSYIKVHSSAVKNFNRWNVRILWKPDCCPSNSRNCDKY